MLPNSDSVSVEPPEFLQMAQISAETDSEASSEASSLSQGLYLNQEELLSQSQDKDSSEHE